MNTLWQDLRQGTRSLARTPLFCLLAALALALGIGANTAVFSVVNGVLLRPLAYAQPDRLAVILHSGTFPVSPADYLDWKAQAHSFDGIGAAQVWGATLTDRGEPEKLEGVQVSPDLFPLLGASPRLGRNVVPGEDQSHVVLLSDKLWQRRFSSDPNAVGQQIALNGESFTIAGVMPPGFQFPPFWATGAELWRPLDLSARLTDRGGRSLRIFGRLKSGVSLQQAQSEIDVICSRLATQHPDTNTGMTARVVPLQEKVTGNIRPTLLVLLATAGLVLLIACANVAGLTMVRASGRRKETAVRLALGSSRARLIRQSLLESLLVSMLGGAAGVLLAVWAVRLLLSQLPAASLPRQQDVHADAAVFWFALAASCAAGIVAGIVPALYGLRSELLPALQASGRSATDDRGRQGVRRFMVTAEVALAVMLVIAAGLMIRSLARLQSVDAGFQTAHVMTLQVAASGQQRYAFFDRLLPRIERLAGVESLSAINHLPLNGDQWRLGIEIAGRPTPPPGQEARAVYRVARPRYFETMRIPLLSGRDFRPEESAPVVIVNQTLAKAGATLGNRLKLGSRWLTVVGVARDVKQSDWTAPPDNEMYLPYSPASAGNFSYMTLVVRSQGDSAALERAIRHETWSLDKNVALSKLDRMDQIVADKLWRERVSTLLLGAFASLAMTLAALGIYGLISFVVAQRTSEIGIRMALGARSGDVARMVLRQGITMVGAGVLIGMTGAWGLTRLLSSLLYGVTATDPLTFVVVPLLVLGVGVVASLAPALRAAGLDPVSALRRE
jgi:predicted permease